ncbi:phosphatidate cytidylyltransferase, mitochondrial isoform X3 [Moschus berezovskii]|uniref:phosphatidate cytidylyltransferase, mitochondrial isoform X3 n=1 Tax=Moschus berezovskii TaxID=68408 RepID=UPI002443F737|nr:phosphatidate cytidylyltransferase, mitochondrial isoform X3 [Moschus berezovskii]
MALQALQSSGVAFRKILSHFPEELSLAFAYGSGVYRQAGPSSDQKNAMLDFVFTVDDPVAWHSKNLKKNWNHYSFLKVLGPRIIAAVQNNYGAGVYYNPLITCDGRLIKYGVISTSVLIEDLLNWNNLYIAGRLQKPVKIVAMTEDVALRSALDQNLKSAVTAAFLMLPESFSEEDLFTEIAGLSYSGLAAIVRPSSMRQSTKGIFTAGDWNAKAGSQETPGVTGKFGLGARNEAGQRLIEFCQENALVITNTLFQQHKRRLYTWTSPDGQHRNQIDYILCNQRWRSCIQLAKTRPGADCGSDHELLIAKFRLKLKKVGKTTRPFRYDLNQIPYDYTVEVRNRFKGLDLIDRVPDELWTEVRDIVQETGTKTIPMEKKCKRAKWLSEEALQIAVKRREAKSKGEKERYKHLNAEFQRIARRDKKGFLSDQCKEIEENNRIGKTRDLFKKIRDSKGTFHAKMGSIKDRNGMDLTEAEDIKKRWQEYTEELYKKDLHDQDSHDNVITDLEPDILECEVKWALESITTNKASGGDGIPVELFQVLKDDAVKVLHSICQQIRKTQQWPQDWKRSVFIPIPKKGNAKECSNYRTIALISHASKVMLKILQARLQQYVNHELPDVQAGFRKGRGTRDQIANIRWIMEKAREFQKNIYFCFIDYAKAFDCVDHNKLWNILKEMGIPDHLTCLLRNLFAGQEATVRTVHGTTDWFQIGKGVRQGCILSPCLFNLYAEYIMSNAGLEEAQAGIKIAGRNINNLRYADDTTLMAESEEELKNLLMKVKEESEKVGLKLNIQKTKIMASGPITSWEIDGKTVETVSDFIFWGPKITADADCSHEIKRRLLLGRNVMTNLDSILKSRDITLPTKVRLVKAMVFPVVMYGCES